MENCVKSRKFIANRTNEYFILACITSYVWKFRSQINQYLFPVFILEKVENAEFNWMNKPLQHFYVILWNLQNYGYFYLPRETKTIDIFQISIFIESAPICGQPIIKLTFKPWFVSVCVCRCVFRKCKIDFTFYATEK